MDFSPRRRSVLFGGLGGAAALVALGPAGLTAARPTAAARSAKALAAKFNFDTGNFIRDLLANQDPRGTLDVIDPMDAAMVMWTSHMIQTSWFDATAPYHPTAVGVYTQIPRRPPSEYVTNRTRNIAALYAMHQTINGVIPERTTFVELLIALGLDPNDNSTDLTTPIGIGNVAGMGVVKLAQQDGMNMLGFEGRKYNPRPFFDYTGYRPVNTAYELLDPTRWQPQFEPNHRALGPLTTGTGEKGIWEVQQHVTPQLRLTKALTYTNPDQFQLAPNDFTNHVGVAYKQSVDGILAASAGLTDEQKVMAELFDNKELGLSAAVFSIANAHDQELGLDGWVHLFMTVVTANIDSLIATWHQKLKYDAVRPVSAIRYVYGNRTVTSWGGPGMGTVHNMPADEWKSYLNTGNFAEYPSGSTGLGAAESQAARRFFGTDVLDFTYSVPAGWSLVEPGITPAGPLTMHWHTWTEFEHDLAMSRVWGGVHFLKSVERAMVFGKQFGDRAYEFVQRHIAGEAGN
ncbi:MAG TPA: hypothetical protein VGS19_33405 [Streptosporangiaceae bacterium]|nr:hypothetical protein [Streptosporangiaceae bacterium]